MIKEILADIIKKAVLNAGFDANNVCLEHPSDLKYGDYSTNIALILAKEANKNPKELAEEITQYIVLNKSEEIKNIEIAGAGFINFYLSEKFFIESVKEILERDDKWGSDESLKNQKIIIEYTDPNPFKEFHIGHLMSNAIGESVSRIIEFSGAKVARVNYQGDVGLHTAKAVWALQRLSRELSSVDSKILGEAYAKGARAYEEYEKAKEEIKEINKKIYNKSDEKINKLYEDGRKISLEYFEKIYEKLGTKFDEYFFESETGPVGKKIVKDNLKEVFEENDGAVIFKGEKYGFHTRVFINSEDLPTYEAKDLALAKIKKDRFDYDKSIIVTANEQKEYYKVVLSAMKQIFPEFAEKTKHITHGMLRLKDGKMSSRTGDVITGEFLIEEVKNKILEKMRNSDIEDKENIAEKIAIGAIKYSTLKQSTGKDIIFDYDKMLSFEGDSGPYLQYSFVRANAVLKKAKAENIKINIKTLKRNTNIGDNLEKLLYRFSEIVQRANIEYEPHHITTYLIELAGEFNSFYAKERIVEKSDTAEYKVALTEAFKITIKKGLWLLGIKTFDKM